MADVKNSGSEKSHYIVYDPESGEFVARDSEVGSQAKPYVPVSDSAEAVDFDPPHRFVYQAIDTPVDYFVVDIARISPVVNWRDRFWLALGRLLHSPRLSAKGMTKYRVD